jgi:hypothetical protein
MTCPLLLPWFGFPNNICWWVKIMKFPTVLLSPFSRYYTLLGLNISLPPCSQTPSGYELHLILETNFCTHTKRLVELLFFIF